MLKLSSEFVPLEGGILWCAGVTEKVCLYLNHNLFQT